jgi:DDE family transposase
LSCQHAISAVPAGGCPACDDPADLRGYLSLPGCLGCLPGPRRRAGMRHRAAVVLAFAAAMAGADSVTAIAGWASDVPPEVLAALGARPGPAGQAGAAVAVTFRRLRRQLDGQALAAASRTWLKAQVMAGVADAGTLVIALDGKTVRGARTRDGTAPHLLAAMITGARAVLVQKDIDMKTRSRSRVSWQTMTFRRTPTAVDQYKSRTSSGTTARCPESFCLQIMRREWQAVL